MNEEAKAAVIRLEQTGFLSVGRNIGDRNHVDLLTNVVAAEFADVVKERDAYKKALGELVKAVKAWDAIGEFSSIKWIQKVADDLREEAAAAEKLLEPKEDSCPD